MHIRNQHSHTTLTSVVLGITLAFALVSVMVTGAYAANDAPAGTALEQFSAPGAGALTVPVVSPFAAPSGPSPTRVLQSSFGSFPTPEELAVDQSTGDVYVVSSSVGTVSRFTSAGAPDNFTAGPNAGTNTLSGFSFVAPSAAELAIAPAGAAGGTGGDIYVASAAGVDIYASEGTHLGQITEANGASFSFPCGVATDNAGKVYIGDFGGNIDRYVPTVDPVTSADYDAQVTGISLPCNVVADSAGSVYASTLVTGPLTKYSASDFGTSNAGTVIDADSRAIAVDPSTDDVYVDEGDKVSVFDSTGTLLYTFGSAIDFGTDSRGVAVMGSGGPAYVADPSNHRIDVYGPVVTVPDVVTGEASALSDTSATLDGTVGSNGVALTDCHFEYVSDTAFLATGFTDLSSGGTAPCSPNAASIPVDLEDHPVTATITGLDPSTIYHFRLVAANANASIKGLDAIVPGAPLLETTGSPTRTATTVRLDSRVDPRESTASYHFEYGDQGPCDSNPCTSTPTQSAGSTNTFELVSQQLTGLKANTTYHYRIAAENGVPGGVVGKDAMVTTRASDAPLTHGHLPGPPGSDRAWEQVSIPDTSGSPVGRSLAISDNGERAIYAIEGGSPGSQYGGGLGGDNDQYAERTSNGWQNNSLVPTRAQAPGNQWRNPLGPSDLSQAYSVNKDITNTGFTGIWRMTPGAPAQLVISVPFEQYPDGPGFTVTSADGSRVLAVLMGNFDPAHPVGPNDENLYDITTGTPHMVGLLPDGSIPSCGVKDNYMNPGGMSRREGWVTADGSYAFFMSCDGPAANASALFVRDLTSSTTVELAAKAKLIRSTNGAAYFTTEDSLAAGDNGGNDIYRYIIQDGSLDCLTCTTAAAGSVISGSSGITDFGYIAVSDDGTHLYFDAARRLLPGAAAEGIYRLRVSDRNVAYVAPGGAYVGGYSANGDALSPDGSVLVFQSNGPALDAVNGAQNGGIRQDYRYDDNDRSLVCVSCPGDGSLPRGQMNSGLEGPPDGAPGTVLTSGGDLVFVTPTSLAPEDQNTALANQDPVVGDDVYEWRDGRLLLVTDGQSFNVTAPSVAGVSRSGRDVFFIQAARLTPDTIDAQRRLYDARIGGGFDFPRAAEPCSLDACQGIPSPSPDDPTPGSASFSGPGNHVDAQAPPKRCAGGRCVKSQPHKRCVKGKVLKHGKCVKKRPRKRVKRVNHNQRGAK